LTSDLYYRDPALFGNQAVVDRYIETIARSFAVQRSDLNVVSRDASVWKAHTEIRSQYAAAKGLMAGHVAIVRRDGTQLDLAGVPEPLLIMDLDDVLAADVSHVQWILVIEKEV